MKDVLQIKWVRFVCIGIIFFCFLMFISYNYRGDYSDSGEIHTTTLGINTSPWFTFTRNPNGWEYQINFFSFSGLSLLGGVALWKVLWDTRPDQVGDDS